MRDDRPFGGTAPPAVVFRFSRDRGGEHPTGHLILDQRGRQALPHLEAIGGGFAVDVALDLEQGVDAFLRLERDRRDLFGIPSLADVGFHVSEFEELAAGMAPAERGGPRSPSSFQH